MPDFFICMKKKILALGVFFATIFLPIAIILVLNLFGKNEYELPIYQTTDSECNGLLLAQNESIFNLQNINLILPSDEINQDEFNNLIERISGNLEATPVQLFSIEGAFQSSPNIKNITYQAFDESNSNLCRLIVEEDIQLSGYLFLLDKDMQIRGYYRWADLKEQDRLIVEIKILETIYDQKLK